MYFSHATIPPEKNQLTLHGTTWHNVMSKYSNQILHIWNLWLKAFQKIYRLSRSVDILEEAMPKVTQSSIACTILTEFSSLGIQDIDPIAGLLLTSCPINMIRQWWVAPEESLKNFKTSYLMLTLSNLLQIKDSACIFKDSNSFQYTTAT